MDGRLRISSGLKITTIYGFYELSEYIIFINRFLGFPGKKMQKIIIESCYGSAVSEGSEVVFLKRQEDCVLGLLPGLAVMGRDELSGLGCGPCPVLFLRPYSSR